MKGLLVGVGALIALAGIVFTLQGVGAIGGSAMSGSTFWAVAGPVIVLAGLILAAVGLRRRSACRYIWSRPAGVPGSKHREILSGSRDDRIVVLDH